MQTGGIVFLDDEPQRWRRARLVDFSGGLLRPGKISFRFVFLERHCRQTQLRRLASSLCVCEPPLFGQSRPCAPAPNYPEALTRGQ